jgi:hypothetical protein
MENMIPPFLFIVAREGEKEEMKLQYQENWHGEILILITRSTRKNLLKTIDLHFLQPPARCRRRREGDQRWWTARAAAAVAMLGQESPDSSVSALFFRILPAGQSKGRSLQASREHSDIRFPFFYPLKHSMAAASRGIGNGCLQLQLE